MSKQYIDIGINLMHRSFNSDRETVIKESVEAGVYPLIMTGTSVRSSESAARYASGNKKYLYSTAGVHPHDAKSCDDRTIEALRKLSYLSQVVAIGECGLDYDRDFSPRDVQRKWFEAQIQLAREVDMPLFLHERAAFSDFKAILGANKDICPKSVVHCFTGTKQELKAYLDLGCYIGITGWICDERRGTNLRTIVKEIPLEKLMIETDAPFLTPRNLKERPNDNRNSPIYLPHIAADIAKCRGESVEKLTEATTANAKAFFNLE